MERIIDSASAHCSNSLTSTARTGVHGSEYLSLLQLREHNTRWHYRARVIEKYNVGSFHFKRTHAPGSLYNVNISHQRSNGPFTYVRWSKTEYGLLRIAWRIPNGPPDPLFWAGILHRERQFTCVDIMSHDVVRTFIFRFLLLCFGGIDCCRAYD